MKIKIFQLVILVLTLIISFTSCSKIANDKAGISDSESQPVADINDVQTEPTDESLPTSPATEPSDESLPTSPATEPSDESLPTNPATEPSEDTNQPSEVFTMPDRSYLGTWETKYDDIQLVIYDVSPTSIQFLLMIANVRDGRGMTFTATAIEEDGRFLFGDGVSTYYRGPAKLTGRFEFKNNSIMLMYDSLGLVPDSIKVREVDCEFHKKSDISDHDIAGYKAGHPEGTSTHIIKEDFDLQIVK